MSPQHNTTAAVQDEGFDEQPYEPVPADLQLVEGGPHLDDEDDTSLAESVILHLISEHGEDTSALDLDDARAVDYHFDLHQEPPVSHPVEDLHFRPSRIVRAMESAAQMREAQRTVPLVPAQPHRP